MTDKQPEALRLADSLQDGTYLLSIERDNTAEELRRLHALNQELLDFAREWLERQGGDENYMVLKARAAIAKSTGETK